MPVGSPICVKRGVEDADERRLASQQAHGVAVVRRNVVPAVRPLGSKIPLARHLVPGSAAARVPGDRPDTRAVTINYLLVTFK